MLHGWLMIIFVDFYNVVDVVSDNPSERCLLGGSLQVFTIVLEVPDENSQAHRATSTVGETPDQIFANYRSNFFAGMQTSSLSP